MMQVIPTDLDFYNMRRWIWDSGSMRTYCKCFEFDAGCRKTAGQLVLPAAMKSQVKGKGFPILDTERWARS